MKKLILLTCMLLNAAWGFTQDILVKKNGERLPVKVLELTPDLVKFKRFDNQEGPTLSVFNRDVSVIKFENGQVEKFNIAPEPVKSETPNPQTFKNGLAINVLPILAQSYNVFYDYRLASKPIIALSIGFGYFNHQEDFFTAPNHQISLTGAAKFFISQSAFYLSPYLKYRNVAFTAIDYNSSTNYNYNTININWNQFGGGATFGARHVFRSGLLIDSFMGLGGYTIQHSNRPTGEHPYYTPADLDIRLGVALGFAF